MGEKHFVSALAFKVPVSKSISRSHRVSGVHKNLQKSRSPKNFLPTPSLFPVSLLLGYGGPSSQSCWQPLEPGDSPSPGSCLAMLRGFWGSQGSSSPDSDSAPTCPRVPFFSIPPLQALGASPTPRQHFQRRGTRTPLISRLHHPSSLPHVPQLCCRPAPHAGAPAFHSPALPGSPKPMSRPAGTGPSPCEPIKSPRGAFTAQIWTPARSEIIHSSQK